MQRSENIQNLSKSLAAFQAEVKNPANTAINPHFKSKYAPLNEILNEVRPILAKYGLSVMQSPSADGDKVSVVTLLMHESGEWLESCPLALKADKPTAQGAGSAITYGRRYSLSAVLGISSEDDDDGNNAEPKKQKAEAPKAPDKPKPAPKAPPKDAPINWPAFWAEVGKLKFSEVDVHFHAGVDSIKGYNREELKKLLTMLKELREELDNAE